MPAIDRAHDWAAVVAGIRANDHAACAELYAVFQGGFRYCLLRQLDPQDVDDAVNDIYMIVHAAIMGGMLRDPLALMGFARTIMHRYIGTAIEARVFARTHYVSLVMIETRATKDATAEDGSIRAELLGMAGLVIRALLPRYREVLTRCFVHDETDAEVQASMDLTATQLRLLKSRARATLDERLLRMTT